MLLDFILSVIIDSGNRKRFLMQNEKNIRNIRYTIFFDKIIPFSIEAAELIKITLLNNDLVPIIFPPISNILIPGQASQEWGLMDKNLSILEVHGNKIDLFSYDTKLEESNFKYTNTILNLIKKLGIRIKRLAFAPTYELQDDEIEKFYESNLKAVHFGGSSLQDFSMNRVYYKTEDLEGYSFNIIYNCTIGIQNPLFINPVEKKRLLILNDINTRDDGNRIYDEKEISIFFNNALKLNDKFLKALQGEDC